MVIDGTEPATPLSSAPGYTLPAVVDGGVSSRAAWEDMTTDSRDESEAAIRTAFIYHAVINYTDSRSDYSVCSLGVSNWRKPGSSYALSVTPSPVRRPACR